MVTLDVLSLLEKKGKTKYWLYHQLGMSYQNFGGLRGILSFEKESIPLYPCSAKRCTSPPRSARNPPRFPV